MIDDVVKAAELILERINDDNARHGGLISRETIRACDEARLVISRHKTEAAIVWPAPEVEGVDYNRDG